MNKQPETLTDFFLARVAEDEEWSGEDLASIGDTVEGHRMSASYHPGRVLADCQAKRRIVERLALIQQGDTREHAWHEQGLFEAIGHLATAYADHPDYRQEWTP